MRHFVALLFIVAFSTIFTPSIAHADDLGQPTTPEAKRHFAEGTRLYRQREFEKAIEAYKAGAMLENAPIFSHNLAQCYRELGRYEEAIWYFERFLHSAQPSRDTKAKIEGIVKQMKADLAKRPKPEPAVVPVAKPTPAPLPAVVPQPKREPMARRRSLAPWIAIGAGALVVAGSGVLYAFDEDPNPNMPDPSYLDTAPYSILIASAGVGAIVVGAVLKWDDFKSAPTVAVGSSSAMLGWTGSF